MKKILKDKLPGWVLKIFIYFQLVINFIIHQIELLSAKKIQIIKPEMTGEVVRKFECSIESIPVLRVYDLILDGNFTFQYPEIYFMKYRNATIFSYSDFVILSEGAVWEKYYFPQFTKIKPLDKDLLKLKGDILYVKKPKHPIQVNIGFSLCGVHCKVWAHFLVQYLPKLYIAMETINLINEELTLVLPKYSDKQIKEIVYSFVKKYDHVNILEINSKDVIRCNILYYVPNTAMLSDHANYISPVDGIIPKLVADYLKKYLVNEYLILNKNVLIPDNRLSKKIFISRKGKRNVINYNEIELFFMKKGYHVIIPHELSLHEKIRIFSNATHLVGPNSSGFTNAVFCKNGTKVLLLSNFQRIFESYPGFFIKNFNIELKAITGIDKNPNNCHSSYYIPINTIQSACDKFGF